jgi:hypothetical protein
MNNYSKSKCKEICNSFGWKKDSYRNVVEINGEKWSFSVYNTVPQCRQTYEDTVGFIAYDFITEKITKYRIKDYSAYTISRISPTGTKAYNIIIR